MRIGVMVSSSVVWSALVFHVALVCCVESASRSFVVLPTSSKAIIVANNNDVHRDKFSGSSAAALSRVGRGGGGLSSTLSESLGGLKSHIVDSPRSDTLLVLATTALNTPVCVNLLKISPILGFLALGILFGPNGLALVRDVHTVETFADLGIVLFLFEMGLHLSFDTLLEMKGDVFGLGLSQFVVTGIIIAVLSKWMLGDSSSLASQVVLGGGLALSSSAFVLQLLKDKDQLSSDMGRKSFGVLLLQDLAVVPLLVVTPILAGSGDTTIPQAVAKASLQAVLALSTLGAAGAWLLQPLLRFVAASHSQDALVGTVLALVLACSFLTEGLGLSNTLGAFLAGVLLGETTSRHDIEREIAPFRGVLVGLFFFTVGFEIDLPLMAQSPTLVAGLVLGLMAVKATIATGLAWATGASLGLAQHVGLLLSQGGEFAFVTFRLARSLGVLDADTTKLMLTVVSLTMGLTPFAEELGSRLSQAEEEKKKKLA